MSSEDATTHRVSLFLRALEESSADAFLTTSNQADIETVADCISPAGETVHVVTDTKTASALRSDFLVAARLADRMKDGRIELRTESTDGPLSSVVVTDRRVSAVVSLGADVATTMESDESSFVDEARKEMQRRWERASVFAGRTPPYSRLLEALEDELGEVMRTDFERSLESVMNTHGRDAVDPVRLSLLMGAKNEVQFYELGHWGETTGLASRAKFSREKQRLEDAGYIDTEKIPREIGRPRQRLVLAETVNGSETADVLSATADVIAK